MNKWQEYWREPDGHNNPRFYTTDTSGKKEILLGLMEKYVKKTDSILEIGCNVGRNLNVLAEAGYTSLHGVEINKEAIVAMKQFFPHLKADIHVGALEDLVEDLPKFDVIFSLAVFEHIPTESEWVFPEIEEKVKKYLFTIEDEKNSTWRHFPRNYRTFFPALTHLEVSEPISGGELDGVLARVFKKE